MLAKIKFLKKEGWGYAVLEDLNIAKTKGKDVYLHALELKGCRWVDLCPGDTIYIERIDRDGFGYKAMSFHLQK